MEILAIIPIFVATSQVIGAAGTAWQTLSGFFGNLFKGKTKKMSFGQAVEAANTTSAQIQGLWKSSLAPEDWQWIGRNYYPKLIEFWQRPVPGLDWWNPQDALPQVVNFNATEQDTDRRAGGALTWHLIWIFANEDISRVRETAQVILNTQLTYIFRDRPSLVQHVQQPGVTVPPNYPGNEPKPKPLSAAFGWLVGLGILGAIIYSLFKKGKATA